MATPTTGTLNVIGSAGGMAPFPTSVYADPDEAGSTWATGSGNWTEGRWAFQLIDNATGQVYDRNDATWAAGAWQPVGSGTGGVAGYPTDDVPAPSSTSYLGLSAGGQFIVLET